MPDLLSLYGVCKSFGGLRAVHDISLKVEPGETVGMIGPNGAGKTTLFGIISGFIKPDRGEVLFQGNSLLGLSPDRICRLGLTRTFQLVETFSQLTVLENVMIGSLARLSQLSVARKKSQMILEALGMEEKARTMAKNLTLAERKRLEIARALATDPSLILVDECLAGLTPTEINSIVSALKQIRAQGITLFLVEHVMQVILSLSDRIIVLNFGEKIAEGSPQEVLRNPRVIQSYLGEDSPVA